MGYEFSGRDMKESVKYLLLLLLLLLLLFFSFMFLLASQCILVLVVLCSLVLLINNGQVSFPVHCFLCWFPCGWNPFFRGIRNVEVAEEKKKLQKKFWWFWEQEWGWFTVKLSHTEKKSFFTSKCLHILFPERQKIWFCIFSYWMLTKSWTVHPPWYPYLLFPHSVVPQTIRNMILPEELLADLVLLKLQHTGRPVITKLLRQLGEVKNILLA